MEVREAPRSEDVRWDLGRLYASPDDPRIAEDVEQIESRVAQFERHRGQLLSAAGIDPANLRSIVEEYEELQALLERLTTYASIAAAADATDARKTSLNASLQERRGRWAARTCFFELGLRRMPSEHLLRLANDEELRPYRHFLRFQAELARHTLPEDQEQIILKKNIAGRDAVVRFREEFTSRLDYGSLACDGDERRMTFASLVALQEHPDRDLRYRARTRLMATFSAQLPVYAHLYGSVIKDHGVEAELRGYSEPIEVENVPNEIPGIVVRNLLDVSRRFHRALQAYYAWKAEKLGLDRLRTSDLSAPFPGVTSASIPWETARSMVEMSFRRLHPDLSKEIRRFFDEERLDAGTRHGKRPGAFCAPVPRSKPYILLSYTGTLNSLVTLAHELGHGVHFVLSAESQRHLQAFSMSKVVAEVASEFGECLLRDHIVETTDDPNLRKQVLVTEVERFIGVVFRQLAFTEFELAAHARAAEGPLTSEILSALWERVLRDQYGPGIELVPNDEHGWATVGHFVFNPFYCYSYALSQVVVLALYRKWKRVGPEFLPRYLDLLRAGFSGTPAELLAEAGIDLASPAVLEDAFVEFEDRVRAAREMIG